MPIVRYFLFVGTALLALLFLVDASFPKLPATDNANTSVNVASDLSVIRIHSVQKWPARVEFDTSLPTVTPAPVALAETNVPAGGGTSARIRDTFAQLQTTQMPAPDLQTPEPKKPEPKLLPKRRTVASRTASKSRAGPPVILVAQQPHFGLFPSTIW
jgi:hypothetical protein